MSAPSKPPTTPSSNLKATTKRWDCDGTWIFDTIDSYKPSSITKNDPFHRQVWIDRQLKAMPIDAEAVAQDRLQKVRARAAEATKKVMTIFHELESLYVKSRAFANIKQWWHRKNEEQRKELLRKVMPDIPGRHLPNMLAALKQTSASKSSQGRTTYLCPGINIEDLVQDNNLMEYMSSRATNHPSTFAFYDIEAARISIISNAIHRRRDIGGVKVAVAVPNSNDLSDFGKVISTADFVVEISEANQTYSPLMDPWTIQPAMIMLESQRLQLQFLRACYDELSSLPTLAKHKTLELEPPLDPATTLLSRLSYSSRPQGFSLGALCDMLRAESEWANLELLELEQDPLYLRGAVDARIKHHPRSKGHVAMALSGAPESHRLALQEWNWAVRGTMDDATKELYHWRCLEAALDKFWSPYRICETSTDEADSKESTEEDDSKESTEEDDSKKSSEEDDSEHSTGEDDSDVSKKRRKIMQDTYKQDQEVYAMVIGLLDAMAAQYLEKLGSLGTDAASMTPARSMNSTTTPSKGSSASNRSFLVVDCVQDGAAQTKRKAPKVQKRIRSLLLAMSRPEEVHAIGLGNIVDYIDSNLNEFDSYTNWHHDVLSSLAVVAIVRQQMALYDYTYRGGRLGMCVAEHELTCSIYDLEPLRSKAIPFLRAERRDFTYKEASLMSFANGLEYPPEARSKAEYNLRVAAEEVLDELWSSSENNLVDAQIEASGADFSPSMAQGGPFVAGAMKARALYRQNHYNQAWSDIRLLHFEAIRQCDDEDLYSRLPDVVPGTTHSDASVVQSLGKLSIADEKSTGNNSLKATPLASLAIEDGSSFQPDIRPADESVQGTTPRKGTKIKTRGTPRFQPIVAAQEEAEPPAEAPKIFLKRAHLETMHSLMGEDGRSQIKWIDFRKAFGAAGFAVMKLTGSVWCLSPSLDLQNKYGWRRPIMFHDPHPSNTLPPRWAARDAHRLKATYGWTAETFVLEKEEEVLDKGKTKAKD